uniref:Integrase, catalytic region, zinc finger, CCHC-type, peptidase aspartic, catalytic n=1 Tax=Tanacetum cinerariifolium TaxID=118510 RepID=A0A6L2JQR8_TANCI|nr:integrase, catalytic region, zinc finger, CCHC-type, peptidase aspartic, catalytic [Tanacetum cinerariifolium]GEW21626.1 integrase, catalytic region, zinc finger, CCHC-type, peptidase aspartic, catalytic [Tanacetum cinerariifolium]
MHMNLVLIANYFKKIYKPTKNNLRTSLNSRNKNVDMTSRYKNDNQSGKFGNQRMVNVAGARENECKKPKRVKDSAYHKEKMLLCKQAEQGVPLQAEQYDWLADTDEEVQNEDGYNVFSNELQHSEQSESVSNTCLVETDDSNIIPDSPNMCEDDIQNDQNDVESDDKRVALANLIANLKLDTKHAEFEKYKAFNDHAVDYDKLEREQYIKIQDLKAQLQDKNIAISELKKLIKKGKGKSVDTKFDKPSVVRQPNAQWIPKPSVLGKPAPFSNSLERIYFPKTKSVPKANVSEGLSKPVTAQTLPQTAGKAVSNTNVLKPGMYRIDNRPHHKSNHSRDTFVPNNSQVKLKKNQVEVHPRIPSASNKIKSVTACKDNLNSRTLNVNVVCATCNKCLVDSNHFACVTKMLNDVYARTKKPNIVQLILFIVDSGSTKHMTGNLKLLCNFVEKFLGTVCFGNDQFTPILGYGDLVQGNVTINRVYYIEGLNHNLFLVGQFCDAVLEVAFCYKS